MSSNKLDELHEAGRASEGTTTPDEDSKEYQRFDRLRLAPKPFSDPCFFLTFPVFNLFSVGSDMSMDLSIFADSACDPPLVLHFPRLLAYLPTLEIPGPVHSFHLPLFS